MLHNQERHSFQFPDRGVMERKGGSAGKVEAKKRSLLVFLLSALKKLFSHLDRVSDKDVFVFLSLSLSLSLVPSICRSSPDYNIFVVQTH